MSNFFEVLKEQCEEYKRMFTCIENYDIEGYAGSYVQISVMFTIKEHIYLAEKMADKDFIVYLDSIRIITRRLAERTSGSDNCKIHISHKFL